jgi:PAS domain S-box-containing protein
LRALFVGEPYARRDALAAELRACSFELDDARASDETALGEALERGPWDVVLCTKSLADARHTLAIVGQYDPHAPVLALGSADARAAVEAVAGGLADVLPADDPTRLALALVREARRGVERRALAAVGLWSRIGSAIGDGYFRHRIEPPGFELVSPAMARITGHEEAALYGDASLVLEQTLAEDRPKLELMLSGCPTPEPVLVRMTTPAHRLTWIELRAFAVRDASGNVVAVDGLMREVTGRVELEERLSSAERLAAVGLLTSGVVHDFNNLLLVLRSTAHTLEHELDTLLEVDHPVREQLGQLREVTEQAANLTMQLLGFTRDRGSNPPGPLDLNRAIQRVVQLLRRLLPQTVRVVARLSDEPALVEIPRSQLDQLMMNLVLNARDAMPDGGVITIETAVVDVPDGDHPRRVVHLSVADTGSGIAVDAEDRIFEPFFSTKPHGTGLGLSTVRTIVRQAGGRIRVHSSHGAGASFELVLPAASSNGRIVTSPPPTSTPTSGPPHTVLLVDDDAMVRRSVRRMLEVLGYQALEAEAADAALRLVGETGAGIDVVVTDNDMPGTTGAELARRLRHSHPNLAVILMSGYVDDGNPRDGLRYLQKPMTPAELDVAIRGAIHASSRAC